MYNILKGCKIKNKIKKGAATLATLLFFVAGAVNCGSDDNGNGYEEPKDQSEVIPGLFDNDASATIKGYFTNTEWAGVADKIKAALNERFGNSNEIVRGTYRSVFDREGGITITVEKNPEYANYSSTFLGTTMYINFAILNDTDALQTAFHNAIRVLSGNPNIPPIGRVVTPEAFSHSIVAKLNIK